MKDEGRLAKRYAKALFELSPVPAIDEMRAALKTLIELWRSSTELRSALLNPAVPLHERMAVVREICGKIRPGDQNFENFGALALENARITSLPAIYQAFSVMVDELKKNLALEITSAFELADAEREALKKSIEADYGSMATIEWRVDRELIGGLVIKAGDRLLDSSVRGSLERIRGELTS